MPVLNSHYGESPYKTSLYGDFLNLYGGGQRNSILYFKKVNHRDHCSEPTLSPDMDPNVPERLLRA